MHPAIEFEEQGSELLLRYSPRDDDSWVHGRFVRDNELVIKRTFHLQKGRPYDDLHETAISSR